MDGSGLSQAKAKTARAANSPSRLNCALFFKLNGIASVNSKGLGARLFPGFSFILMDAESKISANLGKRLAKRPGCPDDWSMIYGAPLYGTSSGQACRDQRR
jgi:hypothetical protein